SQGRLAASSKGLPTTQGHAPGFEIFQQQDIMSNRWMQDIKYMRAVQGELQRQLNEFDFVNKSFVFIREADEELFTSQQKPSEAAVTLDVRRPLNKSETQAVLHTISSFGGANLSDDNITLVTTDGTPLHLPPSSEFASIANSNLEYVTELERSREERAVRDLEQLGVRAVVKVSAICDFDQRTETTTKSEEGALLSSYTTTTKTTTRDALPEGAPGATANMPEGTAASGASQSNDETDETIENFEPSKTETKLIRNPGAVKKYIVSAIIEGETRKATDAEGAETTEYIGLTPEKKDMYEQYILAAVGSGEEETEITINDQPFTITNLGEARVAFQEIERVKLVETLMNYGVNAAKIALIVLVFVVGRRFLRRAVVMPVEEEEDRSYERAQATPEDVRRDQINEEVARMSQENPDAVAALLRTWLAEEED
ncbi:MAG: hypothetical protein NTZ09_11760, partial [Candidatus Hydrogenedentes bacterium]|nr:hypothetical protein [Candidatus Hydrogenedentota bacterium]